MPGIAARNFEEAHFLPDLAGGVVAEGFDAVDGLEDGAVLLVLGDPGGELGEDGKEVAAEGKVEPEVAFRVNGLGTAPGGRWCDLTPPRDQGN